MMRAYVTLNSAGDIVRSGQCQDGTLDSQRTHAGDVVYEVPRGAIGMQATDIESIRHGLLSWISNRQESGGNAAYAEHLSVQIRAADNIHDLLTIDILSDWPQEPQ